MKKSIKFIVLALAVSSVWISCDEHKNDDLGPEISISSPSKDSKFCGGKDTIAIAATIQDNDELHSVSWQITNEGTVLAMGSAHSHDSPFQLNANWYADIQENIDVVLTVLASDHNDNQNEVSTHFHIHMPGDCHQE